MIFFWLVAPYVVSCLLIEDKLRDLPKMYYINLDRSIDREAYMRMTLRRYGLDIPSQSKRVSAVDGKSPRLRESYSGRPLNSRPEIACVMSHLKAIKTFLLDTTYTGSYALIVEDDVSFDFVPYWNQTFGRYIEALTRLDPDWDIFQLSARPSDEKRDHFVFKREWRWHATAYVITRSAAEILTARFMPGETFLFGPLQGMSALTEPLIFSRVATYFHTPDLFTFRDENDSHIHPDHLPFHISMKELHRSIWMSVKERSSDVVVGPP